MSATTVVLVPVGRLDGDTLVGLAILAVAVFFLWNGYRMLRGTL